MTMMTKSISAPLAEWLTQWPSTGGSTYERLQLALRRIPEGLAQLRTLVQDALHEKPVAATPVRV